MSRSYFSVKFKKYTGSTFGDFIQNLRMQKAEETIQEEKNKSIRSMQSEIQNLVVAAASKVVGDQVSPEHSQKLYDDFIAEMGETK